MTRIIKAAERQADVVALDLGDLTAEAREELLAARKEAARVAAEAHAAAEAAERQASENGYRDGFDRGRAEGLAEGERLGREEAHRRFREELGELADLARRISEELTEARDRMVDAARAEMLEMAVAIAEKIVGRVAVVDLEAAKANLRKALERVHGPGEIVVRVNPDQLYALREHGAKLATAFAAGEVRMVADEAVAPGGVRVALRQGEVDATVETQFARVVAELLGPGGEAGELGQYVPEAQEPQLPFDGECAARPHERV